MLAAAVAGVTHHVLKGVITVHVGAAGSCSIHDDAADLVGPIDMAAVKEFEFDLTDPDGGYLTGMPAVKGDALTFTTVGTGDASCSLIYRSV